MGDARRRGSFEERRKNAVKRDKAEFVSKLGERDEVRLSQLRMGIDPFLNALGKEAWKARRTKMLAALPKRQETNDLADAKPIRVQEDEIAWYLFLCEQAIDDPLCVEINQLARTAPFFAGIGARWQHAHRVQGIEGKIKEVLHKYAKEPDGVVFEILVALSYAEAGWSVEMLAPNTTTKSPDLRVERDGVEYFIECKRMARRTGYSNQEQDDALRLWDNAKHVIGRSGQWLWFDVVYHVEVSTLPDDFLAKVIAKALAISEEKQLIYDGAEATIRARPIDKDSVQRHLREFSVKDNSPQLRALLGGDWAPPNASASFVMLSKGGTIRDAEVPELSRYVDDIAWASGMTRSFDAEASIDKKAKDVTKYLAQAAEQVPHTAPSIIHIAAETLEGTEVERRRSEKVLASVPTFVSDKPIVAVRFHLLQANATINKLWEFDETVQKFQILGIDLSNIPHSVIVPSDTEMKKGSHWEIYNGS